MTSVFVQETSDTLKSDGEAKQIRYHVKFRCLEADSGIGKMKLSVLRIPLILIVNRDVK